MGTVLGQSPFMWGYGLAWASLFWSLYEFHGEKLAGMYRQKILGEVSLMEQINNESEEENENEAEVSVVVNSSDTSSKGS